MIVSSWVFGFILLCEKWPGLDYNIVTISQTHYVCDNTLTWSMSRERKPGTDMYI